MASGTEATMATYAENRRKIPPDELKIHEGKWVAFSADGTRIIASCESVAGLDKLVVEAGEDPEEVHFDHLVNVGTFIGGAEFH